MEFKAKKVVVEQAAPFTNDKLNRKSNVDNVSLLLRNISSPIVMSINAPWGHGKTTFLEMLNADLKNNYCKSIYFSAWETDFVSDPLLAFLGEINKEIQVLVDGNKDKSVVWENTKKAGKHILRKGIPALIKVGTAGVIDAEKIIEDESSKLMEGLSKDFIDEYSKNKTAIEQFKNGISSILNDDEGSSIKLYVFIDELDRCRPTYAIELLERIKHLLDIEGLVFVLALDKIQLSHSVKAVYGSDFESIGYLRRFIDIEYNLPETDLDNFIEEQYRHFGFYDFFQSRTEYSAFQYEKAHLKNVFKLLASARNLSLREIEQLFSKINLVILSTNKNVHLYPVLMAFLIIVKDAERQLYNHYVSDNSTPEEIIEYLYSIVPNKELFDSYDCALIEGYLIAAKYDNYKTRLGDSLEKHERNLFDADCDPQQVKYSKNVVNIAKSLTGYRKEISLSSLKQRIDMSEAFKFAGNEI